MGVIYRAVCLASGKIYVGQTVRDSWEECYRKRWRAEKRREEKGLPVTYWGRAMNKHGRDGFEFRMLMANVPEEYLDALEKFFIGHLRSNDFRLGYNSESGGNKHKRLSQEVLIKLRRPRSPVSRWYHGGFGLKKTTCRILAREFDLDDSSLRKVKDGLHQSCCGWVCLDAPAKRVNRGVISVWEHPESGIFVGSNRALILAFPLHKLDIIALSETRVGRLPSHKKWICKRTPNKKEVEAFRIWWAQFEFNNGAVRPVKSPRVL